MICAGIIICAAAFVIWWLSSFGHDWKAENEALNRDGEA